MVVEVDDDLMVVADISLKKRHRSVSILHLFEVNEVRTFVH